MQEYDRLPMVVAPYLTFTSGTNHRSEVVNTDGHGFRLSAARQPSGSGWVDSTSWWDYPRRALLVGGSFAFGVGATTDRHSVASALNVLTPYTFLNLGIRAANSTQELITTIPFLERAQAIVVCTGINNLVVGLQSRRGHAHYGPLFAEGAFDALRSRPLHELAAMVDGRLPGVRIRTLLAEVAGRARSKLLRQERPSSARDAELSDPDALSVADQDRIAEEALERQRRDLSILAKALPSGVRLLFAAQPFAETSPRQACHQEQELFRLTDGLQQGHWRIVKSWLVRMWPQYVKELENRCLGVGMTFVNLNAVEFSGWSFVDRVHMTDHGYLQVAKRLSQEIA